MRRSMTYLLMLCLAVPIALVAFGFIGGRLATDSRVQMGKPSGDISKGKLFILVHGMSPNEDRWASAERSLYEEGQVVRLSYNATAWSNADPERVAWGIGQRIGEAINETKATDVVIVAHSMGALLTRRALLGSRQKEWLPFVKRVVLLAGVNRGWDLGAEPPADVDDLKRLKMRIGYWAANLMNMSKLTFSFERVLRPA